MRIVILGPAVTLLLGIPLHSLVGYPVATSKKVNESVHELVS